MGDDPRDIAVLLGVNALDEILTGPIRHLKEESLAIVTKLGWTIMGKCPNGNTTSALSSLNLSYTDFWSLETIGIHDSFQTQMIKERDAKIMERFEKTNIDVHDDDGKENNTDMLGLRWNRRSDTLRCVSSPDLLNEGQRFTR